MRKRVKLPKDLQKLRGIVDPGDDAATMPERSGHRLNTDYFTIHSKSSWYANPNAAGGKKKRRKSRRGRSKSVNAHRPAADGGSGESGSEFTSESDDEEEEICDIPTLLKISKRARLDREKIETVMNFLEHGGEEIRYLPEHVRPSRPAFQHSQNFMLISFHRFLLS